MLHDTLAFLVIPLLSTSMSYTSDCCMATATLVLVHSFEHCYSWSVHSHTYFVDAVVLRLGCDSMKLCRHHLIG